MPKFIVTVNEQSTVAYFVEAQDEVEASKIYWNFPYKHMGDGDDVIVEVEED